METSAILMIKKFFEEKNLPRKLFFVFAMVDSFGENRGAENK